MKKLITVLLCALFFASAHASETTIKFGARALGGVDLTGTILPKSYGINTYVNIPLSVVDGLGIQPEITFAKRSIQTEAKPFWFYPWFKTTVTVDYSVLELPLLATYTFKITDDLLITPCVGLQVDYITDCDYKIDDKLHLVFATGARGEYSLGPGDIIGGIRYFLSLTSIEGHHIHGVDFTVGYQFKLNLSVSHSTYKSSSSRSRGKAV